MKAHTVNSIPVYAENLPTAVAHLKLLLDQATLKESICISCTGAHGMIEAKEDPAFQLLLQQFYLNLPDGMPLVWLAKLKGYKNAGRCYGPDFFASLLHATANTTHSHFFCGGKPGVANLLRTTSLQRWPGVTIAGVHCPPFRALTNAEWEELATAINASAASIIWIGIGTPKQEAFAAKLATLVTSKIIITVGAAFDFHTGQVKQAPSWVQKIGMEWFFRMVQEPQRLGPRYLKIVPKFTLVAIANYIGYVLKRT
jgi:N-acetylglucosaminyldiphosphoundecaprenol N-acetyl-beta-D-mannosaminyltransferase